MSLRLIGCALLLMVLAAFHAPAFSGRADAEPPAAAPNWQYRVLTLEAQRCAQDQALADILNAAGREGWELVSYERPAPPPFPGSAEGTLLIKPAATGPGRNNTPQTVDSFTGTMELKMGENKDKLRGQATPGCRMLFKHPLRSLAKP